MSVDAGTVVIAVPADARHVTVVRTATASVAALAGATLDEVDDLRLAVGEACAMLIERTTGGSLACEVSTTDGGLQLVLTGQVDPAGGPLGNEMAWALLDALVDEVVAGDGGAAVLTLRKQLSLAAGAAAAVGS